MIENTIEKTFIEEVRKNLPEKYRGVKMSFRDVEKLEETYHGLEVRIPGTNIGACIPVEDLESCCKTGFPQVFELVAEKIVHAINNCPDLSNVNLATYEGAKKHLMPCFISYEGHEEMLKKVPYKDWNGLAVIYRLKVDEDKYAVVTRKTMASYGVPEEQLHKDAMENFPQICPVSVMQIETALAEMGMPEEELKKNPNAGNLLYVVNCNSMFGAAAVLQEGVLENIAEVIGGDYLIIPSSVHELLAVKAGAIGEEEAIEMLHQVNADMNPEDVLSETVFRYDAESKRVVAVGTYQPSGRGVH